MRFRPELMREILMVLEERPAGTPFYGVIQSDEHSQAEMNEHTKLLLDNGYLEGQISHDPRSVPNYFAIMGLTMRAHEFLANARNNTIWKKVMAEAEEKGMSLGATLLDKLLGKAAEKYMGIKDD